MRMIGKFKWVDRNHTGVLLRYHPDALSLHPETLYILHDDIINNTDFIQYLIHGGTNAPKGTDRSR
jgi:hypothetical protein